jgi:hypothetical protein
VPDWQLDHRCNHLRLKMLTVFSEKHKLRDAKTELYGGQLVPPFE